MEANSCPPYVSISVNLHPMPEERTQTRNSRLLEYKCDNLCVPCCAANLLRDSELRLLQKEEEFHRVQGVWNLSNNQGTLGMFFITNVRIVWNAQCTDNFNISIPYIRVSGVCVQDCAQTFPCTLSVKHLNRMVWLLLLSTRSSQLG